MIGELGKRRVDQFLTAAAKQRGLDQTDQLIEGRNAANQALARYRQIQGMTSMLEAQRDAALLPEEKKKLQAEIDKLTTESNKSRALTEKYAMETLGLKTEQERDAYIFDVQQKLQSGDVKYEDLNLGTQLMLAGGTALAQDAMSRRTDARLTAQDKAQAAQQTLENTQKRNEAYANAVANAFNPDLDDEQKVGDVMRVNLNSPDNSQQAILLDEDNEAEWTTLPPGVNMGAVRQIAQEENRDLNSIILEILTDYENEGK